MITKHYCKSIVRAALLLALTTCITGLGPLFSTSARAGSGSFSINDVSGNYVVHGEGYYLGSGTGSAKYAPVSFVALATFTPATGTFHYDGVDRSDGENANVVFDGTYTVDANGHGSMSWVSPFTGKLHHNDFYIVNGGAELKAINTDPPGTAIADNFTTFTKQ
jgi:hypothetical protein